jgi:hypothetical protein
MHHLIIFVRMKLFAFIMALLVLALSIVPCADINASANDEANTEITKSTQQKGDPQQDDCSPFCHCTCCASFSINNYTATVNSPDLFSLTGFSSFLPDNLIERSLPVWQPPKI